jgi:hypothetical protein
MANTFTTNLNLAIPDPGDLNWENEYSDFSNAVDDLGNLLSFTFTVHDAAVEGMVFLMDSFPKKIFRFGLLVFLHLSLQLDKTCWLIL